MYTLIQYAYVCVNHPISIHAFHSNQYLLTGLINKSATNIVASMALFHGGLVQLLGGLWEIYVGNVFAATAFCSYGGFWMSFGFFVAHMIDNVPQEDMTHVVCVGVGVGVGLGVGVVVSVCVSLFLTLSFPLFLSLSSLLLFSGGPLLLDFCHLLPPCCFMEDDLASLHPLRHFGGHFHHANGGRVSKYDSANQGQEREREGGGGERGKRGNEKRGGRKRERERKRE